MKEWILGKQVEEQEFDTCVFYAQPTMAVINLYLGKQAGGRTRLSMKGSRQVNKQEDGL